MALQRRPAASRGLRAGLPRYPGASPICRGPCGLRRGSRRGPEPQVAPRRPLAAGASSGAVLIGCGLCGHGPFRRGLVARGLFRRGLVARGLFGARSLRTRSLRVRARAQGPCPCRRPPRLRRYPQPRRLPHRLQGRAVRGPPSRPAALSVVPGSASGAATDIPKGAMITLSTAGQFGSVRHHGHKAHDPGAVRRRKHQDGGEIPPNRRCAPCRFPRRRGRSETSEPEGA